MVDLAQSLEGWTQSVYSFGCAFIHLSHLHDYSDRDPLLGLPAEERVAIIEHCRRYHGGPSFDADFPALVPYIPNVFEKIASNVESYLGQLESCEVPNRSNA
jgi:hypothetical protein